MSWQDYVDNHLVGTGKVHKAAIIGHQGGVWASSPGFTLSTEEQQAIIAAFKDAVKVQASGLRLQGQKYFALNADARTIQVKKGADGAIIVKSKQAILVAIYQGPIQAPECSPIVEKLGDYLIGQGY